MKVVDQIEDVVDVAVEEDVVDMEVVIKEDNKEVTTPVDSEVVKDITKDMETKGMEIKVVLVEIKVVIMVVTTEVDTTSSSSNTLPLTLTKHKVMEEVTTLVEQTTILLGVEDRVVVQEAVTDMPHISANEVLVSNRSRH